MDRTRYNSIITCNFHYFNHLTHFMMRQLCDCVQHLAKIHSLTNFKFLYPSSSMFENEQYCNIEQWQPLVNLQQLRRFEYRATNTAHLNDQVLPCLFPVILHWRTVTTISFFYVSLSTDQLTQLFTSLNQLQSLIFATAHLESLEPFSLSHSLTQLEIHNCHDCNHTPYNWAQQLPIIPTLQRITIA